MARCFLSFKHPALLLSLFVLVLPAHAQRGALTARESIDQLTHEAAVIVHGHVLSARVEPHPQFRNLMTVVVSMKVEETLRGKASPSLQFRQFIWDLRDQLDAARYAKGAEVLLLLGTTSQYGLTSPVGLEQGRFLVTGDKNGQVTAVNGRGNVGLFDSTEQRLRRQRVTLSARGTALVRQNRPGPVALSDLEDVIRTIARSN